VDGYDARGTWEAIRDAYRSSDPATLALNRLANVRTLFAGRWSDWLFFRGADLAARRNGEYYGLFIALGWWNLGFVAIGARAMAARSGRQGGRDDSGLFLSVGWCILTLAVWVLLMFRPGAAVIHQGSYACVLLLFLCLAAALRRANPAVFGLAAVAAALEFAQVWIPPNPSRMAPLHWGAAAVAALAGAAVVIAAATASPRDPGV
jgi:hypothetical protein